MLICVHAVSNFRCSSVQIEVIMNSRPLTAPSNDPNNFPAFTPITSTPDTEVPDFVDLSLVRKFKQRQHALNFLGSDGLKNT